MHHQELIPNLFRSEFSKIVSVLCKTFGLANLQQAEDITSETFLVAMETWSLKGIPENPTAWLYKVAQNKTKDFLKREKVFNQKIEPNLKLNKPTTDEFDIDLSEKNIEDSQLQMLFAICQPTISNEAQIGLALRILCGFGINEIASAFLTSKETINKRLLRAKGKLKETNEILEFPDETQLEKRLDNVLSILYLLFNEGYYSSTKETPIRKDLCYEAMRLTYLLINTKITNLPKVNALLSLMCFHASRFDARTNDNNKLIMYYEQDKTLWNYELIEKGEYFLSLSSQGEIITKYHIEAYISFWHTKKDTAKKWDSILNLYNQLLQINYSPIVALNRTYALARANNIDEAIVEIKKIDLPLNHLYHCLISHLYEDKNQKKVIEHLNIALNLAHSQSDKDFIQKKLDNFSK
jgi:RNA polymerase sigma-70 factor (ECF subfamily)